MEFWDWFHLFYKNVEGSVDLLSHFMKVKCKIKSTLPSLHRSVQHLTLSQTGTNFSTNDKRSLTTQIKNYKRWMSQIKQDDLNPCITSSLKTKTFIIMSGSIQKD